MLICEFSPTQCAGKVVGSVLTVSGQSCGRVEKSHPLNTSSLPGLFPRAWSKARGGQDFLEEVKWLGESEGSWASFPLGCWAWEEGEVMGPSNSADLAWLPD